MRGLSAAELLEVWERGLAQGPLVRALSLLAAACPEKTLDQLAALSIGQRDARLLELRAALFGPDLDAVVTCPRCGENLELTFQTTELLSGHTPERGGEPSVSTGGYNLVLRPPNSQDLLAVGNETDPAKGQDEILKRCLVSANDGENQVEFRALSAEVLEAVGEKVAELDPLADIQMSISCQSCQHGWRAAFDVVSFLWAEIEAWAGRILIEVHALASAYGWRERDILDLSPARRQFYLDMVGA